MLFSVEVLSQYLLATILATTLTFFGILLRSVRQSRLQGILLLLLIGVAGIICAKWFQNRWLLPSLLVLPLGAGLIEGRNWVTWARISWTCLLQSSVFLLLSLGSVLWVETDALSRLMNGVVFVLQTASVLVSISMTFDAWNVLGRNSFTEQAHMLAVRKLKRWPGVCIQVAAHNEPPELLTQTVKHLLQQDYPGKWLIQVVDNNTADPATWQPIRDVCRQLGRRVRFLHLSNWPGFKAGALNEATRRLPRWVSVIAIVDADYLVQPDFLRATVPQFGNEQVGFVQTPQHYRYQHTAYFQGLHYFYKFFWKAAMTSRRELGSIICQGTMCLIARSALEDVGGWDEQNITEDAELSVRLLSRGWRGVYDHRVYGTGLMPLDFAALKRQRFRWASGYIQTLKKHWRLLLFGKSADARLSLTQRLCVVGIGLQYLAEVPPLLFAVLLGANVLTTILGWQKGAGSLQVVMIGALLFLGMTHFKTLWAIKATTECSLAQALGAWLFGSALSWTTALACSSAILLRKGTFWRTPKEREAHAGLRALFTSAQELGLSVGLLCIAVVGMLYERGPRLVPLLFLCVQACLYGSSVITALAAEGIWLLPPGLLSSANTASQRDFVETTVSTKELPA